MRGDASANQRHRLTLSDGPLGPTVGLSVETRQDLRMRSPGSLAFTSVRPVRHCPRSTRVNETHFAPADQFSPVADVDGLHRMTYESALPEKTVLPSVAMATDSVGRSWTSYATTSRPVATKIGTTTHRPPRAWNGPVSTGPPG